MARLDLEDGSVIDTGSGSATRPAGIAVGEGSVWVTNAGDGTVSRIDVETNEVSEELDAGAGPSGIAVGGRRAVGGRCDQRRAPAGRPHVGRHGAVPLAGQPSGVAYTPDAVWVSVAPAGISRVDPAELTVTFTEDVGDGPTAVLPAFDSIWVTNQLDDTVSRLEPSTGRALTAIPVGEGPNSLGLAGGKIWVANEFAGSVTAIDPTTNDPDPRSPVDGSVASLAADGDRLWLSVGASAARAPWWNPRGLLVPECTHHLGPVRRVRLRRLADAGAHERRTPGVSEGGWCQTARPSCPTSPRHCRRSPPTD